MPVLGDPDNTPNHYPPINGWEDLLSTMYPQDDIDLDAVDNLKYDAIINIYIKEKTRYKYQGANKHLLLWMFYK